MKLTFKFKISIKLVNFFLLYLWLLLLLSQFCYYLLNSYLIPSFLDPFSMSLSSLNVCVRSCLTLYDPMGCNSPGSLSIGIFQARILEWVSIFCSRGSFRPGIEPESPASPASAGRLFFFFFFGRQILYHWAMFLLHFPSEFW